MTRYFRRILSFQKCFFLFLLIGAVTSQTTQAAISWPLQFPTFLIHHNNQPVKGVRVEGYYLKYDKRTKKSSLVNEVMTTGGQGTVNFPGKSYILIVKRKGFKDLEIFPSDLNLRVIKKRKERDKYSISNKVEWTYKTCYSIQLEKLPQDAQTVSQANTEIISYEKYRNLYDEDTKISLQEEIEKNIDSKRYTCARLKIDDRVKSVWIKESKKRWVGRIGHSEGDDSKLYGFKNPSRFEGVPLYFEFWVKGKNGKTKHRKNKKAAFYLPVAEAYEMRVSLDPKGKKLRIESKGIDKGLCVCEKFLAHEHISKFKQLKALYGSSEAQIVLEDYLWKFTSSKNTLNSYITYLDVFPENKDQHDLESLFFDQFKNNPSYWALLEYRKVYGKGNYEHKMAQSLDKKRFHSAKVINSIRSYEIYLANSPNGSYRSEAKKGIQTLKDQMIAAQKMRDRLEAERRKKIAAQKRKEELKRKARLRESQEKRKVEQEAQRKRLTTPIYTNRGVKVYRTTDWKSHIRKTIFGKINHNATQYYADFIVSKGNQKAKLSIIVSHYGRMKVYPYVANFSIDNEPGGYSCSEYNNFNSSDVPVYFITRVAIGNGNIETFESSTTKGQKYASKGDVLIYEYINSVYGWPEQWTLKPYFKGLIVAKAESAKLRYFNTLTSYENERKRDAYVSDVLYEVVQNSEIIKLNP